MMNKAILSICVSMMSVGCGFLGMTASKGGDQARGEQQGGVLATSFGVLTLNDEVMEKGDTIKLYNSDGSLWYQFSYYYDDSDGVYDFQNENFQPYAFHPDYFVLALSVVKKTDDSYTVIANQKNGLEKVIPKVDFLKFYSWADFITSKVFAIRPNEESNPVLSDNKKRTALKLNLDNKILHPVLIQDDWLKVKWKEGEDWSYGWVRWKDKSDLLISLSLIS